jgi:hypothetical protein
MEKIAKNLQLILMCIILISTVIAVGIEIKNMFLNQSVTLADLLVNVSIFRSSCNGKGVLGSTIN